MVGPYGHVWAHMGVRAQVAGSVLFVPRSRGQSKSVFSFVVFEDGECADRVPRLLFLLAKAPSKSDVHGAIYGRLTETDSTGIGTG